MNQKTKNILTIGFLLYILVMLWLLFGQRIGLDYAGSYVEVVLSNLNLTPFQTIHNYLLVLANPASYDLLRHAVINLAGNVIMFIPLGFFLPAVSASYCSFVRSMMKCAVIILIIEIIQLFTLLGSCDIDDFILNMVGTAIGYGTFSKWFH